MFDVLEFLIRARDKVVSRDDLLAEVWHGRIVSEATLSSRVNAARTAIGDNGEQQRLIRTLPRKGFRFVGEVIEQTDSPSPLVVTTPAATELLPASRRPRRFVDRGAALHQYERGPRAGLFRRRYRRGNHHRAVPLQRTVRDRAQLVLHLQVQAGRHSRDRPHARRQLRARRQRPPRRRAAAHHRAIDRRPFRCASVGRQIRRRPQRCIRPAGPHHRTSRAPPSSPTLRIAEIERRRHSRPNKPDAYDLLLRASGYQHDFTPGEHDRGAGLPASGSGHRSDLRARDGSSGLLPCAATLPGLDHPGRHPSRRRPGAGASRHRADAERSADPLDGCICDLESGRDADRAKDAAIELFSRSLAINPNSATALALAGWIETMRGQQQAGRALLDRARRA